MDAQNRFSKYFFEYLRLYMRIAGHDVFDKDFKPHFYTNFLYAYYAVFVASNIYSCVVVESRFDRILSIVFLMIGTMVSAFKSLIST